MGHKIRAPRLWTVEQARAWRQEYEADTSLTASALAERTGLSQTTVVNALLSVGATVRATPKRRASPRRRPAPPPQPPLSTANLPTVKKRRGPKVNVAEMVSDYEGGMGIRDVAEQHGISYGKAHAMLHEAGVEMRPRGGSHPVGLDDDEIEGET